MGESGRERLLGPLTAPNDPPPPVEGAGELNSLISMPKKASPRPREGLLIGPSVNQSGWGEVCRVSS